MNAPDDNAIVFYVLMRSDMASMNPGKAVAQGTHAANQFVWDLEHPFDPKSSLHGLPVDTLRPLDTMYGHWVNGRRGFGTCITLAGSLKQIEGALQAMLDDDLTEVIADWVHDPTYPLLDGQVVHEIPLDTCAYVFGFKNVLQPYLTEMGLMP